MTPLRAARNLDEALSQALEDIEGGLTPLQVLDRYPDYEDELGPLLETAYRLRTSRWPTLSLAARVAGREKMHAAVAAEKERRRHVLAPLWLQLGTGVALAVLAGTTYLASPFSPLRRAQQLPTPVPIVSTVAASTRTPSVSPTVQPPATVLAIATPITSPLPVVLPTESPFAQLEPAISPTVTAAPSMIPTVRPSPTPTRTSTSTRKPAPTPKATATSSLARPTSTSMPPTAAPTARTDTGQPSPVPGTPSRTPTYTPSPTPGKPSPTPTERPSQVPEPTETPTTVPAPTATPTRKPPPNTPVPTATSESKPTKEPTRTPQPTSSPESSETSKGAGAAGKVRPSELKPANGGPPPGQEVQATVHQAQDHKPAPPRKRSNR